MYNKVRNNNVSRWQWLNEYTFFRFDVTESTQTQTDHI